MIWENSVIWRKFNYISGGIYCSRGKNPENIVMEDM